MRDDDDDGGFPPLSRPTDPWTSHAAEPRKEQIARDRLLFLRTLAAGHRPMNDYEVAAASGKHSIRRRSNELEKDGLIEWTGATNKSPYSNRQCQTFVVTPAGYLRLKE